MSVPCSEPAPARLLRARTVLPIAAPAIADGAILLRGSRIEEVGSWARLRLSGTQVLDCGEVTLLPGLINAHCHLDYTGFAGQLAPPKNFPDWLKGIIALKAAWSYSEFAQSWLQGAAQLLAHGTTTVADVEAVPELLPQTRLATPLRVLSFLELISIRNPLPAAEQVRNALITLKSWTGFPELAGLSPHALYTTHPELLRQVRDAAHKSGLPVMMHVAESAEEFSMFTHGSGSMWQWLKSQRTVEDCGQGSPVAQLAALGLLNDRFLAVHVNHLGPGDAASLQASGAHVVHCPRSHAYFQHAEFPWSSLTEHRINVCLGTDSLASVRHSRGPLPQLNLFAEMQEFARRHPDVAPETILAMCTQHAARALGLTGKVGQLTAGAEADIIALPQNDGDVVAAALHHSGPVRGVLMGGKPVYGSWGEA